MLTAIATWIVVGGANRIIGASVDQGDGGVTEWGRHVRGCAAMIVREWEGVVFENVISLAYEKRRRGAT
jgi:hypothetical protein